MITASRYHDFSAGHRVAGHENKCAHLHGHNYRVHFTLAATELDTVGRVLDFSVIKSKLCMWLEENWDHKMILWKEDPIIDDLRGIVPQDIVIVPFNPTAENMAKYLVLTIGPKLLEGTDTKLIKCQIEETRKCKAAYELSRI